MIRDVSYRIYIIRQGGTLGQLRWENSAPPTVYFSAEGAIHASLSGTFFRPADFDPLADELHPILTVDGQDFPLGIYRVATNLETTSEMGQMLRIDAYDRGWVVQSCRTENILHLSAGTPYLTAVQQLLTAAGISLVLQDASSAVLQTDREDWQLGTDYLTIVNTLLAEINYNSLWFDDSGFARLSPAAEPSPDKIAHRYGPAQIYDSMPVSDVSSQETDLYNKYNVFVVVCSNPDLAAPMVATSVNDDPTNAASTVRRGMRITQLVKVDNIASQEELQAYADRLRSESQFSNVTVSISTLADGGHGLKDTVALNLPGRDGLYEEIDWKVTMQAGALMTHTLRKVVLV